MVDDDRVTVAIPFIRDDESLRLAITSVRAQTYGNFSLILYGDGVGRADLKSLENYIEPDSRITLHTNAKRYGLAAVLNQIAHMSRTRWLFRMDADDVMHPERLRRQLDRLIGESREESVVAATGAFVIDEDNRLLGRLKLADFDGDRRSLLNSSVIAHPTVAASTEWFRKNPYNTDYDRAQDKELWLRTSPWTKFTVDPEPLLYYRIPTTKSVKVSRSGVYNRQIIKTYGPELVGSRRTHERVARDWLYSRMKVTVERVPVVRKGSSAGRYIELTANEFKVAESSLKRLCDLAKNHEPT